MKNRKIARALSMVLTLVLLASTVPESAFARSTAETDSETASAGYEVTEEVLEAIAEETKAALSEEPESEQPSELASESEAESFYGEGEEESGEEAVPNIIARLYNSTWYDNYLSKVEWALADANGNPTGTLQEMKHVTVTETNNGSEYTAKYYETTEEVAANATIYVKATMNATYQANWGLYESETVHQTAEGVYEGIFHDDDYGSEYSSNVWGGFTACRKWSHYFLGVESGNFSYEIKTDSVRGTNWRPDDFPKATYGVSSYVNNSYIVLNRTPAGETPNVIYLTLTGKKGADAPKLTLTDSETGEEITGEAVDAAFTSTLGKNAYTFVYEIPTSIFPNTYGYVITGEVEDADGNITTEGHYVGRYKLTVSGSAGQDTSGATYPSSLKLTKKTTTIYAGQKYTEDVVLAELKPDVNVADGDYVVRDLTSSYAYAFESKEDGKAIHLAAEMKEGSDDDLIIPAKVKNGKLILEQSALNEVLQNTIISNADDASSGTYTLQVVAPRESESDVEVTANVTVNLMQRAVVNDYDANVSLLYNGEERGSVWRVKNANKALTIPLTLRYFGTTAKLNGFNWTMAAIDTSGRTAQSEEYDAEELSASSTLIRQATIKNGKVTIGKTYSLPSTLDEVAFAVHAVSKYNSDTDLSFEIHVKKTADEVGTLIYGVPTFTEEDGAQILNNVTVAATAKSNSVESTVIPNATFFMLKKGAALPAVGDTIARDQIIGGSVSGVDIGTYVSIQSGKTKVATTSWDETDDVEMTKISLTGNGVGKVTFTGTVEDSDTKVKLALNLKAAALADGESIVLAKYSDEDVLTASTVTGKTGSLSVSAEEGTVALYAVKKAADGSLSLLGQSAFYNKPLKIKKGAKLLWSDPAAGVYYAFSTARQFTLTLNGVTYTVTNEAFSGSLEAKATKTTQNGKVYGETSLQNLTANFKKSTGSQDSAITTARIFADPTASNVRKAYRLINGEDEDLAVKVTRDAKGVVNLALEFSYPDTAEDDAGNTYGALPLGAYKYYVVYGTENNGTFTALTLPEALTLKVEKLPTIKPDTKYTVKLNSDGTASLTSLTVKGKTEAVPGLPLTVAGVQNVTAKGTENKFTTYFTAQDGALAVNAAAICGTSETVTAARLKQISSKDLTGYLVYSVNDTISRVKVTIKLSL